MGTNYRLLVYSLLVIGFISCNKELEPIFIIKRSTEAHGGIESWKNLKSLSFTKKTNLYKEDGSLKSTILQNQKFDFENNLSISLNSILDSVKCNLQNGKVTIQNKDSIYRPVGEELNKTQALFSLFLPLLSRDPVQTIRKREKEKKGLGELGLEWEAHVASFSKLTNAASQWAAIRSFNCWIRAFTDMDED